MSPALLLISNITGCLLKGTQVYTLQGVLMCSSDYNTIIAKQQKEQLSKMSKTHKLKNRSHSSSSLLSSKTRGDVVISPPIQSLEHTFNKNTTMVWVLSPLEPESVYGMGISLWNGNSLEPESVYGLGISLCQNQILLIVAWNQIQPLELESALYYV